MPRGYWSAILAVLGLVTLSLSAIGWMVLDGRNQNNNNTESSQSATAQNQENIEQSPPRNRAGLPNFAQGITDNPKPESDTERANRDLAAQESMAAWAFWLLLFTGIGLLVTSVATGFLLWQIVLTRKAVKDTGDATEAMKTANEIAHDGLRPWIEIGLVFDFISKNATGFIIACNVELRNLGKMPAYHANIEHFHGPTHMNPIHEFRIMAETPPEEGAIYNSEMIVLPGGSATDQELIFFEKEDPRSPFDEGIIPQIMILVHYELPNGSPAQSAAWFSFAMPTVDENSPELILWDFEEPIESLDVQNHGYIRIT